MKLKELLCVVILYRFNFQNLHWNSAGENFDNAHKEISSDYYNDLDDTMDTLAEMCTRLGVNPPNFKEVLDTISSAEKDYLMVDTTVFYDRNSVVKFANIMLGDICNLLAEEIASTEMQDKMNAGMRSELETILNQYDLQYRYINKRKLENPQPINPVKPDAANTEEE